MAKLTRRGLLKQTSIGVAGAATIGVLTAVPQLSAVAAASEHSTMELPAATHSGPMVAHVRDFSTGEISLMVGEREIVYRDPALVARLLNATR